jgi:hypothetical protein
MNDTLLTPKDYELLSAYLDNVCSPREKVLVENRIKKDLEFAQALLEFKHARKLLQALPKRRAPRNFVLSASQVPSRPQRFFLVPTLNYVAMAATLFLAVVFIGSTFLPGMFASKSAAPMAEVAMDSSAAATPMIITWGSRDMTAKSGAGMGGGGSDNSAVPSTYSGIESALGVGSTETATEQPMLMAQAPSATEGATNPILGIAPGDEQGKVVSPTSESSAPNPLSLINIAEIVLGSIALLSFIIAMLVKKLR